MGDSRSWGAEQEEAKEELAEQSRIHEFFTKSGWTKIDRDNYSLGKLSCSMSMVLPRLVKLRFGGIVLAEANGYHLNDIFIVALRAVHSEMSLGATDPSFWKDAEIALLNAYRNQSL